MVKLTGPFSKLQKVHTLVIGDFMLDRYTYGEVRRISPEAPVSILKVDTEKMLPGGAGNVVLNLLSLGSKVTAIGRVGDDLQGDILKKLLKDKNANVDYLYTQKNYKTSLKNRFIAESQQILRVDFEKIDSLLKELEEKIIKKLEKVLKSIDIVAISDYGKGFLSDRLLKFIIDLAKSKNIPVIVDPKGKNFKKYEKATILKPNLKEAYAAANLNEYEDIELVSKNILDKTNVDFLMITRSKDGISVFSKNKKAKNFPVKTKEVKDVTGAGDTVLAMLCIALASKLSIDHACELCNIAASIAIEHIGCKEITLSLFAKRLLEYDIENKIFDFSHLFTLKKVLEGCEFSLLGINSTHSITDIFKSIKKLSKKNHEIIIYILDENPKDEFVDLLSSINEVSFIILNNSNLKNLIAEINPTNIYAMKKNQLNKLNNTKELIKRS
ncbi:MAG: Bifunctional protein HldE [Candidatus Anoxychlamydiales bacterium]|nr:Bifunctional protein HldE [Candidatus Anoxychlamydiales bacterium]